MVNPNPNNEASRNEVSDSGHEHSNQERNAAEAAAATQTEFPQPDETKVEILTSNPYQEAENTVDGGARDNETTQKSTAAASSYDHCHGK